MNTIICECEKEHQQAVTEAKAKALSNEALAKACKIFDILSEPIRLKIVLALLEGEMCVYHLTEVCGGTVSGVSHQLRLLRDNHIVKTRRLGKNIEYSLADGHVKAIVDLAIVHLHCEEKIK